MSYVMSAKKCPKCGHKSFKERADLRYCSRCGYALHRVTTWQEMTPDMQVETEKIIEKRRRESYFIPKPRDGGSQ